MGSAKRVALLGECMLELRGTAFGAMQQGFGGDTLNTAVYLARLGRLFKVSASYATALGDDALSDGMLQRWSAEGVDTSLVRRLPGRMPGLYQITVDARGERSFSYWRDQSAAKAYFHGEESPLERAADEIDALYLSGISLAILPPSGRERAFALMRRLHERGVPVVFDNNYRPRLWSRREEAQDCFLRAYTLCSIALITLDDEAALHGLGDAEAAQRLARGLPCAEVVMKRGAGATLVRTGDGHLAEVPTQPVGTVVDTTAAGDSFGAGYVAARLGGADPRRAAEWGNRLAARVIQHPGALIPREAMADLIAGIV